MAYELIEEIGEGGFGVVTKVRDEDGNIWAMKTYKAPNIPDIDEAQLRKRFEREVRYQSNISHPNVVSIVDSNLEDNPPFFVMELAECSLLDEIQDDHTLGGAPNNALFNILAGLEAIHTLGITHRDLKPGNILKFENSDGET